MTIKKATKLINRFITKVFESDTYNHYDMFIDFDLRNIQTTQTKINEYKGR